MLKGNSGLKKSKIQFQYAYHKYVSIEEDNKSWIFIKIDEKSN